MNDQEWQRYGDGDVSSNSYRAISIGAKLAERKDPFEAPSKESQIGRAFLGAAAGPLGGWILGAAMDAYRDKDNNQFHARGIEEASKNGVPGFLFEEKTVGGSPIRVAVDSSQALNNPDSKPVILISAEELDNPEVIAFADAVGQKSLNETLGYSQQVAADSQSYRNQKDQFDKDFKFYLDQLEKGESATAPQIPEYVEENPSGAVAMHLRELENNISSASKPQSAAAQNPAVPSI